MTTQEAKNSIGQQFKVTELHGGILGSFDVIRSVSDDGIITGDFIEAHAEDCRLKGEQPEHLKRCERLSQTTNANNYSPATLF